MKSPRILLALPFAAATALVLGGCASAAPAAEPSESAAPTSIAVEDNHGTQTVSTPPAVVVATDNRTIQTLAEWGIAVAAAPLDIFDPSLSYKSDDSVVNLGNHGEPDLEAVVAVDPDLIVNGQRFASYYGDFQTLVPDATIVELDPREGEPFDEELTRQVTVLGEIFGHQEDAAKLVADFEASIERVKAAYDDSETVMAVITSGGSVNYAAPTSGRTLGPVFDVLGLTPSLTADGSTDHQGDDISVEAIAATNPDWLLVMDRDAAVSSNTDEAYTPADELISGSEALGNVTAVTEKRVVYMPANTYLNEGIQTYTVFFNALADAMES